MTALLGNAAAPAHLLALDPGSPDLGIAIFRSGILISAYHIKVPRPDDARCPTCATPCRHGVEPALVVSLCDAIEKKLDGEPTVVISEHPQIFQMRPRPGQPEGAPFERGGRSLFLMCAVMAAMLDRAAAWRAACYQYTPAVWKGSKRKDEHQMIALASFTNQERARLPRSARKQYFISDALDAAALGLWWHHRARYRQPAYHMQPHAFRELVEPVKAATPRARPAPPRLDWRHR